MGNLPIGEVTTLNLNMIEGGVQMNVIPDKLKFGFDMRITPTTDLVELEKNMNTWCEKHVAMTTSSDLFKNLWKRTSRQLRLETNGGMRFLLLSRENAVRSLSRLSFQPQQMDDMSDLARFQFSVSRQ